MEALWVIFLYTVSDTDRNYSLTKYYECILPPALWKESENFSMKSQIFKKHCQNNYAFGPFGVSNWSVTLVNSEEFEVGGTFLLLKSFLSWQAFPHSKEPPYRSWFPVCKTALRAPPFRMRQNLHLWRRLNMIRGPSPSCGSDDKPLIR